MTAIPEVVGVLLAGGKARRMGGGDKCLIKLGGKTLLELIAENVAQQVDHLVLNANGDLARFDRFGLATMADSIDGHPGPLAGVLSGMIWAQENVAGARWVATFPADSPFLPGDLVRRLCEVVKNEDADLGTVFSNGRAQPVCGLWPVRLAGALREAIVTQEVRKVDAWTGQYRCARVVYEGGGESVLDPFFNINSPEDLVVAQQHFQQVDERP